MKHRASRSIDKKCSPFYPYRYYNGKPNIVGRKLFIEVKKEHFKVFIENEDKFKSEEVKALNKKALEYYEMFLMDHSNFVEVFSKYEPEDLIEKLNKNIRVIEYL